MKMPNRYLVSIVILLVVALTGVGQSQAKLAPGQTAPGFSAKDLQDKPHDLSQVQSRPMVVLYFFDIDSKPSQEGELALPGTDTQGNVIAAPP